MRLTLGKSYEAALDVSAEHLSKRYAMDFRESAKRYGVIGTPTDAAEKIAELIKAGVRDIGVDVISHPKDRDAILEQFAKDVIPRVRSDRR